MERYKLLFTLKIKHAYYDNGMCRKLDIKPSKNSAEIIKKIGLILKTGPGEVSVFYNENKLEAFLLYANDASEPFHLDFKVFSSDPWFLNFTDLPFLGKNDILFFDNEVAKGDASREVTLSKEDSISEKDLKDIFSPEMGNILTGKDILIRPLCIVKIRIKDNAGQYLLDSASEIQPASYMLNFKNKSTYWAYYLPEVEAEGDVYVSDMNNEIEFEGPKEIALANGKPVTMFRTKLPIPLQERPTYHFQLKKKKSSTEKILIKRLPVASTEYIQKGTEDIPGKNISEIFIYY